MGLVIVRGLVDESLVERRAIPLLGLVDATLALGANLGVLNEARAVKTLGLLAAVAVVVIRSRVNVEDAEKADAIFNKLMGEEVLLRKNFISSRATTLSDADLDV